MSWNKNTIVSSQVDPVLEVLNDLGIGYDLTKLGEVYGRGLNDEIGSVYPIRRFQVGDMVYLEKMVRTCDCDVDDEIVSSKFLLKDEPIGWSIEVNACVCGSCREAEAYWHKVDSSLFAEMEK